LFEEGKQQIYGLSANTGNKEKNDIVILFVQ